MPRVPGSVKNLHNNNVQKTAIYEWKIVLTLIRKRQLRHLIWVDTICSGMSLQILRVNTVCCGSAASLLTLKAPSKICSRWHSKFFFYISEKTSLDISWESSAICQSSAWQMIHMKCQDLFSLKKSAVVIGALRVNLYHSLGSFSRPQIDDYTCFLIFSLKIGVDISCKLDCCRNCQCLFFWEKEEQYFEILIAEISNQRSKL